MLGLKRFENTGLRTGVRGVSRFGTLLGVVAMVGLLTGCDPCLNNPCDDGTFCNGAETCAASGSTFTCTDGTAPCDASQVCNEATDACETPACMTDADCADDGNACTDEACVDGACTSTNNTASCDDGDVCTAGDVCADGACTSGSAVAGCCNSDADCDTAAGETCDTATNQCAMACSSANDCDDTDPCTDDACVNGACQNTAKDCDDGLFCTGAETCNADTGACESAGDPCAADETCNETTGVCDPMAACMTDSDCDDAVFCNGAETCDANGNCVAGSRPCADANGAGCSDATATEDCSEGDTAAVCTPCPSPTQDFTLGSDNLTGTTGDDTFDAPLIFNQGNGAQVASLQTGDSANGLAGNDTLNAQFNAAGANTVVPTTIAGIEVINITDFGANASTLSGVNLSGATNINSVNSTQTVTVNALAAILNLGLTNTANGINATFVSPATDGASDSIDVTMDSVTGGTATVATGGANGFETVNFVTNGTSKNTLASMVHANSSLKTAMFNGAADLVINTLPNTITTYDASLATCALTLGTGNAATAANGGTLYASFATVDLKSFTGSMGNDTLIFAGTLDGNDASGTTETIDGGPGTDVIQATFTGNIGTSLPLANFEEIRFNAMTNSASVNLTGVTGLTTATVEADGNSGQTLTLLNISGSPLPTLNYRGDNKQGGQTYDAVSYQPTGVTGGSDSLTITVGNRGTALNASGTTNVHTVGTLQVPGVEVVTLTVTDGPATFSGINTNSVSGFTGFTATASSNLTLGTVNDGTSGGTSTTVSVNLSAVTGNSNSTFDDLANGASVTLGAGNDTFTSNGSAGTSSTISGGAGNDTITGDDGSADVINGDAGTDTLSGGTGNDTINGGADDDTITGGAGVDTLTGGSGNDKFVFAAGDSGLPSGTVFDTISDYVSAADIIDLGATAITQGTDTTAGAAAGHAGAASGVVTFNAGDNTLALRIVAVNDALDDIANDGGATDAVAGESLVFGFGADSYIFISDGVVGIGANDVLIKLTGIAAAAGTDSLTIAGGDITGLQ